MAVVAACSGMAFAADAISSATPSAKAQTENVATGKKAAKAEKACCKAKKGAKAGKACCKAKAGKAACCKDKAAKANAQKACCKAKAEKK